MSRLFLTGFMGSGKSTVGRLVASRLGRPFVDLDEEIARREGASVAELFSERGEAGFRDAEHRALKAMAGEPDAVVATGGGIVLRDDNRVLLRSLGTVVHLAVTPEEAIARLGDASDRPLLAGQGIASAREILSARMSLYAATADHAVDTTGRSAEEVAGEVVALADGTITHVRSGDGGYDVVVEPGIIDEIGERVASLGAGSVAVVTDERVRALYGERARLSLEGAGLRVIVHAVPAGEGSKSWSRAGELLEEFVTAGLDRRSAVVALGGGVVGDLAGFCASAYMRGIAFVQAPTTLLAQVDSSIGGKTGVDLEGGKNLAGAFWPPRLVCSDTQLLASLPACEWTNGLVEAAKAAALDSEDALARFEGRIDDLVAREQDIVTAAVREAVAFKARVVGADERESGLRECLNLGHTLGHAIEVAAGYGCVPHGLAVAEGMRFAATLAERVVGAPATTARRTGDVLARIGAGEEPALEALVPASDRLTPDRLMAAMRSDKKSRGGVVRFVLLERAGRWVATEIEDDVLTEALGDWAGALAGRAG